MGTGFWFAFSYISNSSFFRCWGSVFLIFNIFSAASVHDVSASSSANMSYDDGCLNSVFIPKSISSSSSPLSSVYSLSSSSSSSSSTSSSFINNPCDRIFLFFGTPFLTVLQNSSLSFSFISSTFAIFPSLIHTIRCAACFKFGSCVTIIIVIFSSSFSLCNKSMTIFVFTESKSPVGSSSSNISGLFAIALAIVTLCCSPPDNCDGTCVARSSIPTWDNKSFALFFLAFDDSAPFNIIGISTFSNAVIVDNKLNV
mmetsp:Transcript_4565/g.6726  ORF Transcript_4565/g.6726 Transcript_4565/m.6726 type:complete len:256 (-) Transcript_4565:436-1203(-)